MGHEVTLNVDAIIMDGGVVGLASAAFLARKGQQVVLLNHASDIGGLCRSQSIKGYQFNLGTSFLWGFGEGEVFDWLFRNLKIDHLLPNPKKIFSRLDPSLQVILPEHRLNIYSDRFLMLDEIQREFPSLEASILKVYNELDELEENLFDFYSEKHSYSMIHLHKYERALSAQIKHKLKLLKKRKINLADILKSKPDDIAIFFQLQCLLYGGDDSFLAKLPLTSAAVLAGITKRGIYQINGNPDILVDILKKVILEAGGKIYSNITCKEILLKQGGVNGIKFVKEAKEIELKSKFVITTMAYSRIRKDLLKNKIKWWDFLKKKSYSDSLGHNLPVTLLLGVNSKVIPEPMNSRVVYMVNSQQNPRGNNLIFISVSPENDKAYAPKGKRTLIATYWLNPEEVKKIDWDIQKNKMIFDFIERLEHPIPFITDYIECRELITPVDYLKMTNTISVYGKKGFFSYGKNMPNIKTPVKGLYSVNNATDIANGVKAGLWAAKDILTF